MVSCASLLAPAQRMINDNKKRLPAHFVRFTIPPSYAIPWRRLATPAYTRPSTRYPSTMESWVIIRAEPHRGNNMKGLRRALVAAVALVAVALLVVAQFVLFDDAI